LLTIQLEQMLVQRKRIAIWGGTGKAAVFLNRYRLDAKRFPIVVDSDPAKVDTFVPGQGQRILFRDHLLKNPVDVIIIPMAWRAQDVLLEIQDVGIHCEQVLVEHQGTLVDFHRDLHPYATAEQVPRLTIPAPHYNPQRSAYWAKSPQIAGQP
jgi:protein O-GlcNAc transferase